MNLLYSSFLIFNVSLVRIEFFGSIFFSKIYQDTKLLSLSYIVYSSTRFGSINFLFQIEFFIRKEMLNLSDQQKYPLQF